jgi:hypothetical protein
LGSPIAATAPRELTVSPATKAIRMRDFRKLIEPPVESFAAMDENDDRAAESPV